MAAENAFLDQVLERDLDLIIAAELFSSERFRILILRETSEWNRGHELVSVRVSEATDAGETDVTLVVTLEGGDRLAILLEDKISAAFQRAQAERYRERARQGVVDNRWQRFRTCLVAPRSYINAALPSGEWDAYLPLERIAEWATSSYDRHETFLRMVCTQAVSKYEARAREISAEATAFWRVYRELAAQLLPEISITRLPSAVGRASPWPQFGSTSLPRHFLLEHKPQQGCVDLTFSSTHIEALGRLLTIELPFDVRLVPAGKSSALRIAVPRINHLRTFQEQEGSVFSALCAVERLLMIGRRVASTALGNHPAAPKVTTPSTGGTKPV